jgi:lipoprotein-anchoring transpeptidase ErfK/SrfK
MRAIDRRRFVATGAAALLWPGKARGQEATEDDYFAGMGEDHGVAYRRTNMDAIEPEFRRQVVRFRHGEAAGTVVVDIQNHFLYLTFENNIALRYGCGVGREGFQWFGRAQIMRKAVWPDWTPPPEMRARQPHLPTRMKGGWGNPLGPRAMYLYRDGRDLLYRIHGTVEPWTIGSDVSSGCIRLLNEDVIDLFTRAPVGTRVHVIEFVE